MRSPARAAPVEVGRSTATFVLVHSPLVGPASWRGVADALAAMGHRCVVPSLVDATRTGPPFVPGQVAAVVASTRAEAPDGPVVVVGHSGAGPLLPAVGAALAGRVQAYVFVDAALPAPGRTRADDLHPSFLGRMQALVEGGVLPPWHRWWSGVVLDGLIPDPEVRDRFVAELAPLPWALFDERLPDVPGWPDAPCAYLRLSAAYAGEEATAAGRGWPVTRVDGSHLEVVVRPAVVVDGVLRLLRRLEL